MNIRARFSRAAVAALGAVVAIVMISLNSRGASAGSTLPGDTSCDGQVNAVDAALILQRRARLIDSLPCARNGDVNADFRSDSTDAALVLQFHAGLIERLETRPIPTPTAKGDVNCDGRVNGVDAALILQYIAGLIGGLPCIENGDVNGDGTIDEKDAAWLTGPIICANTGLCHPFSGDVALPTSNLLP